MLSAQVSQLHPGHAQRTVKRSTALYSKVKSDLGALLDDVCVEAFFLVRRKLVGQGGGRGEARKGAQKGQEGEEKQHVDGRAGSTVLGGRPDGTRDGDERCGQSVRLSLHWLRSCW